MSNFKNQTMYQIYLKSFSDSNGDGVGDLNGIVEKLDYFEYLGVDMLWITPFFVSPQKDNGYDVEDYYRVDPRYGTMQDFEHLCESAKQRNIGIMLDMVFNHTSTNHEWFQKALAGNQKYKDYYIFKQGRDGNPPTNWVSKFGGNAWQYVEKMDEYYLHLFDKTQADLNWDNPAVRQEMEKIVHYWMEKGVDGFRFDVVNLISKPVVLEDDYQGDGRRFYTDGPNVHQYLTELNQNSFGNKPNIVTVGEMSSTNIENCIQYAGDEKDQLSMVFNFHHLKVDYKNKEKWSLMPFDFKELKNLLNVWQFGMQKNNAWNALFWNNHDQPRSLSRFGNDKAYMKESAKMLATVMFCMRGTPYIYQGEEIGMKNAYFDHIDQYRDVESLNYYEILKEEGRSEQEIFALLQSRSRDNSRTPMQWNMEKHGGFTKGTPWIDVPSGYEDINVEVEMLQSTSILQYYRKLIQLRKELKVISHGVYESYLEEDDSIFAFKRKYEQDELLVLNNFYAREVRVSLNDIKGYEVLTSNYPEQELVEEIVLRPYESLVYYRKN